MEPERVLSNHPEAFQCQGCRYDLRGLGAIDGILTCPECGERRPFAELGTLVAPRPIVELAAIACGPTLAIAILMLGCESRGLQTGTFCCFITMPVVSILLPPIAGPLFYRGRLDRVSRRGLAIAAILIGWAANGTIFFVAAALVVAGSR